MPDVISQDARVSYSDQGQGEPALLFLPGWCGSRKVFDPVIAACSKRRRTLALDWRGHGESAGSAVEDGDFGADTLVENALSVIKHSGVEHVIPVTLSHAGWVAIELRRRLGAHAVRKLVLLDWIVLDAPPPFIGALKALQDPAQWQATRDQLFSMWLHGTDIPALNHYVRKDMGSYPFEMWARAGREIGAAYAKFGSPLQTLAGLDPPPPTLHMYSQPDDPGYLGAQQAFSAANPWFAVRKLPAHSHFPTIEAPGEVAAAIESFVTNG